MEETCWTPVTDQLRVIVSKNNGWTISCNTFCIFMKAAVTGQETDARKCDNFKKKEKEKKGWGWGACIQLSEICSSQGPSKRGWLCWKITGEQFPATHSAYHSLWRQQWPKKPMPTTILRKRRGWRGSMHPALRNLFFPRTLQEWNYLPQCHTRTPPWPQSLSQWGIPGLGTEALCHPPSAV